MEFETIKKFKITLTEEEARKVFNQLLTLPFNKTNSPELWDIYDKLLSFLSC